MGMRLQVERSCEGVIKLGFRNSGDAKRLREGGGREG